MNGTLNKYRPLYIYLALALATLAVYRPVRNYDFINYDDPEYVTQNQYVQAGITRESVVWAFTTPHTATWNPVTQLSHMLDCELFGLNAGWHHLTSLLFHIANTLLLFAVLKRITGNIWLSAFVAAAFALHPLRVESVAWLAERKDVLSAFFWMLTMWAYVRYIEHPEVGRYLPIVVFFVLGLMAKPMLVTLPFILLLLDYWPLGRFQFEHRNKTKDLPDSLSAEKIYKKSSPWPLLKEKIPLFILALVWSVITFIVHQSHGALKLTRILPLKFRVANAFVSYMKYIGKMVWPSRLAVLYPHTYDRISMWQVVVSGLLLFAISFWVIRSARSRRFLPMGWLWYLVTLVPVIGLVQTGSHAMADRFTYLPSIGIFIMTAWGASELLSKWTNRKVILGGLAMMILLASSICTRLQLRYWRNSITLFEHTLAVTSNNSVIHDNLGLTLQSQGKFDEAIEHHRRALQIDPYCAGTHFNLGQALNSLGKFEEAITHFTEALRINPNFSEVHSELAYALASRGRLDEAIPHFIEALRFEPDNAEVHVNFGLALARQGKLDEAVMHFTEALRIKPNYADAHSNLGYALAKCGKLDEAVRHYTEALRIKPNFAYAHYNLGVALARQGKFDEAIAHFNEALRINPDFTDARKSLEKVILQQSKSNEPVPSDANSLPEHRR
jgi:tetratricopeptide (TPR) repeat protein